MESPFPNIVWKETTFSLERVRGRTGDEAPVSYIDHEVDVHKVLRNPTMNK